MLRLQRLQRLRSLLTVVALLVLSATVAYAQVGGNFDLSWSVIDGGGGTASTGGSYNLGGTIGQPDAGRDTGGQFTLDGGFWGGAVGGPSGTPTRTPTRTGTPIPSDTPARTHTPLPTQTPGGPSATPVPSDTSTSTRTPAPTDTHIPSPTSTHTPLPTQTPGGPSATPVPSNTSTSTRTPAPTDTHIPSPTSTHTPLPTQTPGGPSATPVPSDTRTPIRTDTPVPPSDTPTNTHTPMPTQTPGGPSATPIPTDTRTHIPTTHTNTPTHVPTQTPGGPTATTEPSDTPIPTDTQVVLSPTPTSCPIQFTDVPVGSTFYPFIRCLACRGIINGYPDNTFRPNNNVTRGQLSKIISNAAGFIDPQTTQMFNDVPVGSTFFDFVGRLASRGYIGGYPCGGVGEPCVPPGNLPYFRPNNNATRGQISKIDSNAAGFSDTPTGQQFEDVAVGSTYYTYTYRLVSRTIMAGYLCGGLGEPCIPPNNLPYFRPNANATRGQTSKIVGNTFFPDCQTP
jgi:hypothetical protein